jgi:hypothetical protein
MTEARKRSDGGCESEERGGGDRSKGEVVDNRFDSRKWLDRGSTETRKGSDGEGVADRGNDRDFDWGIDCAAESDFVADCGRETDFDGECEREAVRKQE